MKKYRKTWIALGLLLGLCGLWIWEVGFHTGKYTRQETPFNVPMRIVRSMIEGAAISEKKAELVVNAKKFEVGQKAPDFNLPGIEPDQMIALSDFAGKVVMLEFWASWCGDCRKKNGYLWDLYKEHQSSNFEILGISMDRNFRAWKKAIQNDNMIWTQVCDGLGANSEVIMQYGIYSLPRNLLLDEDGIIVGMDWTIKEIDAWLEEKR